MPIGIKKNLLNKTQKFKIFGNNHRTFDGMLVRDFTHVDDLTKIHYITLKICKSKKKFVIVETAKIIL